MKKKFEQFSVLMSVYINDDVVFLRQAFQSLIEQSANFGELVVVCDGPITIEQENVLNCFKEKLGVENIIFKNPRLERNQGLGKALNFGVDYCSRDYIVRMDSDDISAAKRIEWLSELVERFPTADVIGSQIEEFKSQPGDLGIKRIVPEDTDSIFKYSKIRNPMNHVSVCIKRSSLESAGGYENVLWHEDYFLWVKMLSLGMKLINVSDVHVYVRVGELGSRRNGLKYLKSEYLFLKRCYRLGHFNLFNILTYMSPRLFVRLMPSKFTGFIYRYLRTSK